MARLAFCDYHNMIAILEKYEQNQDFYPIVDFVEASHIRYALTFNLTVCVSHIRQFWSTARIETMEDGTKILATIDGKLRTISESSIRRNLKLNDEAGIRDGSQGEACPTITGLVAGQDRANITKSSTFPSDSTPRVTSLAADEGKMASKIEAQELEITNLKARVKLLEDREGGGIAQSGDDAPINGRSLDEGEEADKKGSDDTAEMVTVLTSLDASTVLSSEIDEVPTGSGSIPTAGPPATGIPTGSDVVPTASLIFTTTTESIPYTKRKGKEKMVESDTPKKKKLQKQIDVQVARELEEEMARDAQRMNEQIARDAKITRIHAEEELQMMIDGLDRNKETIAKYLQEYHQFATELPIERRIELIILMSHAGWKAKHFKGMTLEEIKEKFDPVWKQMQDFIPMGSKEEGERFKRKGLTLEQESAKKVKITKEVTKEKLKEMMQLIPVKEIYVEALQVKHLIIDWEAHTEGQRSYWKIIRLGGSSASYQFFMDLLKHLDREDLNQLWALVKETLNIRSAANDKEKELWVELKRFTQSSDDKDADEVPGRGKEGSRIDDQARTNTSTQDVNTARPKETGIFDYVYNDKEVGAETNTNNLDLLIVVNLITTIRVDKDHPKEQIIGDLNLATQTRRMLNFSEENAMIAFLYGTIEDEVYVCQPPGFEDPHFSNNVYKVEKALYGLHQAPRACYETLSTYLLENRFRRDTIDKTLSSRQIEVKHKDDGIFISQDKYVADILKKFDFSLVKTASTPIETHRALLKDEEAQDVNVYLYRSMIGSLIYLTASRPNIMLVVYTYARFKVTPKVSHLHVVKRIFRYLKGSCQFLRKRLILWQYKKQTIVANSTTEAEYVNAASFFGHVLWIQNQLLDYGFNLMNTKIYIDNKSTICSVKNLVFHSKTKHIEIRHHFIRDSYKKKLIQVIKIHTDHNVADLLKKAFDVGRFNYLVASIGLPNLRGCVSYERDGFKQIIDFLNANPIQFALIVSSTIYTSCIEQFWTSAKVKIVNEDVQLQALVDEKKVIVNEASIRCGLRLDDAEGTACLPNAIIFEELARIGAETTAWKEFSSTMASAIIYLANNQKFNFPRIFVNPSLIKKIYANMKRVGTGFSGAITPLFATMMVQAPKQVGEIPTDQPSSFQPQIKHKTRRKQRKETWVPQEEPPTEEHIPTPSHDPLPSAKIEKLKKRVNKLKGKKKKRTHGLKRLNKVGLSTRIVSSDEEGLERINEEDLFGVHYLSGDEVFIDVTASENVEHDATVAEKEINTANPVTTAGEAKDKGKGVMIEPKKPLKIKDQIALDEEVTRKLEAEIKVEMEEEEMIAKEKEEAT
nr:putative ribonuclease H-like domain-containing protein [Tanacetum cinerariifolium]